MDCLFYDLDKHTDTKLIEKLYQEVQKAMLGERDSFESKSTKASGNMSEDLPELEDNLDDLELPQLKAKSRSDFYEVPAGREVLDFDDLDEFDLPDINTLVLSKWLKRDSNQFSTSYILFICVLLWQNLINASFKNKSGLIFMSKPLKNLIIPIIVEFGIISEFLRIRPIAYQSQDEDLSY